MSMRTAFLIIGLALTALSVIFSGCSSTGFRFADSEPVWKIDDQQPIPLPKASKYIKVDYYYKVLVRRPAVKVFHYPEIHKSRDVNSRDQVPGSSWFTPRLGYRDVTPEELLLGPQKLGPPVPPVRVVRAKHLGTSPGFIIADSRDYLYLIKFDPPNFPAVETATAFIVNRLFWGFGYNVPEDYIFYFNSNEMPIDSTADISEDQVKIVFSVVAPPQNGIYRATASLLLGGRYLGPIADSGVRKDDPNDIFPHQERRVLRALRVFGGFTNHTDLSIDNTLDVYVGQPGEGHVKHYLLDFGEALGAHGTERGRIWDGFTHVFSFNEMFSRMATLGLSNQEWENITYSPWKSVAVFESEYFHPGEWKESYPFEPLRRSLPDDDYWAAKVVAAVTRDHVETLVAAANYPEFGAAEYVTETLMQRRQKVIDYFFAQVSPMEFVEITQNNQVVLEDLGLKHMSNPPEENTYEIHFLNDDQNILAPSMKINSASNRVTISIPPELMKKADNYLRMDVTIWRGSVPAPRPAQFHLRSRIDGRLRMAGVVH